MLTLAEVAEGPHVLTQDLILTDGSPVTFRPLTPSDAERLAAFLTELSTETRRLSTFEGYDLEAARRLCDAIARYDKLRLVLDGLPSGRIAGLLELSLDLTDSDIARYHRAGIHLGSTACRFGATLADDCQGRGLGTQVFPLIADITRRFGNTRIILWGGVVADNLRAIRYYEKVGFRTTGAFTDADGVQCLDMILELGPCLDPTPPLRSTNPPVP